jgi:hypothetical protein
MEQSHLDDDPGGEKVGGKEFRIQNSGVRRSRGLESLIDQSNRNVSLCSFGTKD